MAERFLDRFTVLLLDLNGTFMFGQDRFGPDEDYYATYRSIGGERLSRESLLQAIRSCCEGVLRDYESPDRFDDFPSLAEAFRTHAGVDEADVRDLERVFAVHEMGYVPDSHADFLRRVAKTHQLGIVSNICALPDPWLEAFERSGLRSLFSGIVFSSTGRSIKPSHVLFRQAFDTIPVGSRVLFAGDSLERDVIPAKALGLSTAWIAPRGSTHAAADIVIESLVDLETAGR
jgi:putative hydrolase of the HAD superfamily